MKLSPLVDMVKGRKSNDASEISDTCDVSLFLVVEVEVSTLCLLV
jgi:hypothetical protein